MSEHTGSIRDEKPPSCPECGGWNHRIEDIPIWGITWRWYCTDCENIWKTVDSGESAKVYLVPTSNIFHESESCPGKDPRTMEKSLPGVVENRRPCGNCTGRSMKMLYDNLSEGKR